MDAITDYVNQLFEQTERGEAAAARRFDLFAYQQRTLSILLGWAVGSIAAGAAWWRHRDAFWRGMSTQFISWGAVDGVIALIGLRSAQQDAEKRASGALDDDAADRKARRFELILWGNAALDVLYVLSGAWLLRRYDNAARRGMGWGIILQGGFLGAFDAANGAMVHRRRQD